MSLPKLLPGRYSLEVWVDDEWTGSKPVGHATDFDVGHENELRKRAESRPPTVEGTLERILLTPAQPLADGTRQFFRDLGPFQVRELLAVIAKAVDFGSLRHIQRIPWWLAAESLGSARHADARRDFWQWLMDCEGSSRLHRLLVSLGIERWQGQVPAEMVEGNEERLWQVWLPLGAWNDLARARYDRNALVRCHSHLGWPDPERDDSDGDPFGRLPDCGSLVGYEFQPEPNWVNALDAHVVRIPGRMFDRDGWRNAALETLKQLSTRGGDGQFERSRQRIVGGYLRWREPVERMAQRVLRPGRLDRRWILPRSPVLEWWPVLARMSLAVALARRQMARGRRGNLPAEAVLWLDEAAVWLERWMPTIYERDLCYAEILCLRDRR